MYLSKKKARSRFIAAATNNQFCRPVDPQVDIGVAVLGMPKDQIRFQTCTFANAPVCKGNHAIRDDTHSKICKAGRTQKTPQKNSNFIGQQSPSGAGRQHRGAKVNPDVKSNSSIGASTCLGRELCRFVFCGLCPSAARSSFPDSPPPPGPLLNNFFQFDFIIFTPRG